MSPSLNSIFLGATTSFFRCLSPSSPCLVSTGAPAGIGIDGLGAADGLDCVGCVGLDCTVGLGCGLGVDCDGVGVVSTGLGGVGG